MEFLFFLFLATVLLLIAKIFPCKGENCEEVKKDRFKSDDSVVNDSTLGSYID